jgi:hypothetical protein
MITQIILILSIILLGGFYATTKSNVYLSMASWLLGIQMMHLANSIANGAW